MPFTSPMLAGARIRLLERRSDLVVPHPGGARGVYIFALGSLSEFCAPTMHDVRLAERLRGLQAVSPHGVRLVARATAMEGAAGRAAAAAAAAADAGDAERRHAFEAALLHTGTQADDDGGHADPAQRTRAAVMKLAGRTGRAPEGILADLAILADHLVAVGLDLPAAGQDASPLGRGTQLLGMMADTARQIRAWVGAHPGQATAMQVAEAIEGMQAAARLVRDAAQALANDPASLLSQWAAAPEQLVQKIGRADLLLDGWQMVCLLWQMADDDAARLEALMEASTVLPPFPPEGEAWLASRPDVVSRLHAPVAAPAQRAGGRVPSQVVALVARNERIRALAA